MYRSSSSGISPEKLREACIDYLQKYASPLDSSEIDDHMYPAYQKATKKYMSRQIDKEVVNSARQRGKSYANSVVEAAKQRTNRIHEQIAALVGRDRIVVTERTARDAREERMTQSNSPEADVESEEITNHLSFITEVGPVKWRDIHDLQKSVVDIQKKLHKVENFFSSFSTESLQRINQNQHLSYINYASRLKESESRVESAAKLNPVIIDKVDADKIRLYEKFAKKLIKNETAKKQLLEDMRQEIQTLAKKEEVQKKVENHKARRAQSVTRVGSVERLSIDQLRKVKPVTRDSGKVVIYTDRRYAEEVPIYHMKAKRDYHQEFLKRRAMLSQWGYPRGTQTNSSRDERIDGLVNFNRPSARQTVPTEVNTTILVSDRNSGNVSSDQYFEMKEKKKNEKKIEKIEKVEKNERNDKNDKKEKNDSKVVRAIPPKEDVEPAQQPQQQSQQQPQKKSANLEQAPKNEPKFERQMSQPLANNPNPTEELKTITLKVPNERKPYHSSRGKSTGHFEPAQPVKIVPTSSQNIEASKLKNYLPQVKGVLEKSDKRKTTWGSIMEKDMKKTEKHELLKVNIEQLEEKAKMSKQKIKLAKNKQDKIDEKDNLDQYYLDSIKTKLAMINQLNGQES